MPQQAKLCIGNQAAGRLGQADLQGGGPPDRKFLDKRTLGVDWIGAAQQTNNENGIKRFHCPETLDSIVPYIKWIQSHSPILRAMPLKLFPITIEKKSLHVLTLHYKVNP